MALVNSKKRTENALDVPAAPLELTVSSSQNVPSHQNLAPRMSPLQQSALHEPGKASQGARVLEWPSLLRRRYMKSAPPHCRPTSQRTLKPEPRKLGAIPRLTNRRSHIQSSLHNDNQSPYIAINQLQTEIPESAHLPPLVRESGLQLTPLIEHPKSIENQLKVVEEISMQPEELNNDIRTMAWDFQVSKALMTALPRQTFDCDGTLTAGPLLLGSRLCQIRCVKIGGTSRPTDSEWVALDNAWPKHIIVLLNDLQLNIPQDLDNTQPSSVDATLYVREGINRIVALLTGPMEFYTARYMLGVETVAVADRQMAAQSITFLPSQEGLERVLNRTVHSDPEFSVDDSRMVLDMTDPFTNRMFKIPVRGTSCRHDQCFDRDIFLQTRDGANSNSFRCPICGRDARPQNLVIDGFLVKIRDDLEKRGKLDTKAIVLDSHGVWNIKEPGEKSVLSLVD